MGYCCGLKNVGDLNVVIVAWDDATSQVSSVTDSKGNLYQLAVGPTVLTGVTSCSQAIYYAKDISAGARDGSFGWRFSRHFVPGYDQLVPPGQKPSASLS